MEPAKLMNHTTAFMEIPTASHVLLELRQRAVDLLFPAEPATTVCSPADSLIR